MTACLLQYGVICYALLKLFARVRSPERARPVIWFEDGLTEFVAIGALDTVINVAGTVDLEEDAPSFTSEVMSMISGSRARAKVVEGTVVHALELCFDTFGLNVGCRIDLYREEWGSGHVDGGTGTTATGPLSGRRRNVLL